MKVYTLRVQETGEYIHRLGLIDVSMSGFEGVFFSEPLRPLLDEVVKRFPMKVEILTMEITEVDGDEITSQKDDLIINTLR